jgi:hypothetical protein
LADLRSKLTAMMTTRTRKVSDFLQVIHGNFTKLWDSVRMTGLCIETEKTCKNTKNCRLYVPIVFSDVPKLSLTVCDFSQRIGVINWLEGQLQVR